MMEDKYYYKDGTTSSKLDYSKPLHRTDGPAVDETNGTKQWLIDGKLHKIDGPAIIWGNSTESMYFIDDIWYSEVSFIEIVSEAKALEPILQLTDPRWWVRELANKTL